MWRSVTIWKPNFGIIPMRGVFLENVCKYVHVHEWYGCCMRPSMLYMLLCDPWSLWVLKSMNLNYFRLENCSILQTEATLLKRRESMLWRLSLHQKYCWWRHEAVKTKAEREYWAASWDQIWECSCCWREIVKYNKFCDLTYFVASFW